MIFVNRRDELYRLDRFAEAVERGSVERHLAFVGVRRIGKSRILAHFVETRPALTAVVVQVDEACTTPQAFLLYMARATADALARSAGRPALSKLAGPVEIASEAGAHGPHAAALFLRALALVEARRPDGQQVFSAAVTFPEEVATALNRPILVLADEFQHILDLAVYPPFSTGGRSASAQGQARLLGVLRALIERRPHVGWVVTGSSVRLLRRVLGEGPLMGRFDERFVGHFDPEDCAELASAIWRELGVEATDSALARVYRLTQGHPFYADAICREAALGALKLDRPVSASAVDGAFLEAATRPGGAIWVACREMFDSLSSRAPALQGILQALAAESPASLGDLAQRAKLSTPHAAYRYVEDLVWLGMIGETTEKEHDEGQKVSSSGARTGSRLYGFVDPIFHYWLANASDPLTVHPSPLSAESARRAANLYQEAYLRERELHGTLGEGYVRDLCRAFDGQSVEGRRLGVADQWVTLPRAGSIERIVAEDAGGEVLGRPAEIELDLCLGQDPVWLGEVKRRRRPVDRGEIELVLRKARLVRRVHRLGEGPTWVISESGFTDEARELARASGGYLSSFADLEAIRAAIATRPSPSQPAN